MTNINFTYNIEPTTEASPGVKGFIFNPEFLEIYFMGNETVDNVEVVNVRTILIQRISNGTTKMERHYQFPLESVTYLINGFDPATMKPVINNDALNAFLATFELRTVIINPDPITENPNEQ